MRALPGMPLVEPGDALDRLIIDAARASATRIEDGDVLVVAQKVVSKAEDCYARLDEVAPTERANKLAEETVKDPRLVQLILDESNEVVRHRRGVLVVEHRLGVVMANAGIDRSNIAGDDRVLLLPRDPDASAERLAGELELALGVRVAVVINDSVGRPFRSGTASIAIGAFGLPALDDLRGAPDLYGRPLEVSLVALADQLACAGALLMGEGAEGLPVVRVRGLPPRDSSLPAASLLRERDEDLFR